MSQREMSEATGIPLATYQRLEIAKRKTLNYEYMVRCAIVLGVDVDELIEDKYKRWTKPIPTARRSSKAARSKQPKRR